MTKKIRVFFKEFHFDEFVHANTSDEALKKMYPNALKFETDKSFSSLSHGRSG